MSAEPKQLTIRNGDNLRKWIMFSITVLVFLGAVASGWFGVCGRMDRMEASAADQEKQVSTEKLMLLEKISDIKVDGTRISQQTAKDVIAMKVKLDSIDYTVKKIAEKLNVN